MSEMVERCAKAAATVDDDDDEDGYYEKVARAVILAMREPTEEMIRACERERVEFETGLGWTIMIDAALNIRDGSEQ